MLLSVLVVLLWTACSGDDSAELCDPADRSLSTRGQAVLNAVTAANVIDESPTPLANVVSHCNLLVDTLIDGPAIFGRIGDLIAEADHEVVLVFGSWEPESEAAALIGDGIRRRIDDGLDDPLVVRVLIDDFTAFFNTGRPVNRLWESQRAWDFAESNVSFEFATYPHSARGNLHDKFVIVDGADLVVTGANVQVAHDSVPIPWHDTGYHFRGPVVRSALATFDILWEDKARHWECEAESGLFDTDCDRVDDRSAPGREWMGETEDEPGFASIMVAGKTARGGFSNDITNPQDQAIVTMLEGATSHARVLTPNANDDDFRDAVVEAVLRGVRVELLLPLGFNHFNVNLPFQGGDNQEVVGNLRQRVAATASVDARAQFQPCWYGRDAHRMIEGNGPGASHAKFLTVDGAIGIVGSGNMDSQSWNNSHEFNVVIDDPITVGRLDTEIFLPDLASSVCGVVELYEDNGAQGEMTCPISLQHAAAYRFKDTRFCDNDHARSAIVQQMPKGATILVFDDSDARSDRPWAEFTATDYIDYLEINTFETTPSDPRIRFERHNGGQLDGKVSRLTVLLPGPVEAEPRVEFYDGNGATQNLVCVLPAVLPSVDIQQACPNDEIRSAVLHNIEPGTAMRVFDNSGGSLNDDWAVIVATDYVDLLAVDSFEAPFSDSGAFLVYSSDGRDLDGKISRIEFLPASSLPATVAFYDGSANSASKVCELPLTTGQFTKHTTPGCGNDRAEEAVLFFFPANARIRVYDDGDCRASKDDWTDIVTLTDVRRLRITTFENSVANDARVRVDYHGPGNLDGKVSCIRLNAP